MLTLWHNICFNFEMGIDLFTLTYFKGSEYHDMVSLRYGRSYRRIRLHADHKLICYGKGKDAGY